MLRVAFATSAGSTVDQHFGWCDRFDVYDLSATTAALVASRIPVPAYDSGGRIEARLAVIRDCAIVHLANIGGAAAARVINARIHPLKVAEGTPVSDLTIRLQAVLAGNPPPWLRKAIRDHDPASTPMWSPR